MHIIEPGKATYYIDSIVFEDDDLLSAKHRERKENLGGSGIELPERDEEGVWHVQRNIILGLNIPDYY